MMLSDEFRGLCIGGPNDGMMLAHCSPRFEVYETAPIDITCSYEANPQKITVTNHEYRHNRALRGEFEIDLWTYDRMTVGEAFTAIFSRYAIGSTA